MLGVSKKERHPTRLVDPMNLKQVLTINGIVASRGLLS